MKWRPDIEGLRGIAVLLVVLYHAGIPWLGGGFVGVDVFFVLSGYLITRLLVDELTYTGTVSLRAFYARRIRRLLPAAALVIVATLAVSQLVLSPLRRVEVASSATAAAAYAANVVFAVESADYFGADVSTNPLLHMWSLSVEEQFYVVWPVLLLLAWRFGGRRGLAGALAIVAVGGFALSAWLVDVAPQWAFYGTHSRAWQFAVGGLAGLLTLRTSPMLVGLGWAGLAAVLTSGVMLTDLFPFPGLAATPVTLGTAAVLLAAGAAPSSLLGGALSARPLRELGRLSYSWYLWHWPALVLAEAAWGPLSVPARLGVAAGSLALSEVTYRLLENPVRHHTRLVASPRLTFALLAALLVVTAGGATAAQVITTRAADAYTQRLLAARDDIERSYADGCLLQKDDWRLLPCVYGDPNGDTSVVLYGDSHASHWFPAVERLAVELGWRLLVRTKAACPPASISTLAAYKREVESCLPWRAAVIDELAELRPEIVIVSWAANHPGWPEGWNVALASSLRELGSLAAQVVYVLDTPAPGFEMPDCLAAGRHECVFTVKAGRLSPAAEVEAARAAGVQLVDLTNALCPDDVCPALIDGTPTWRDFGHLSATYAASLTGALAEALGVGPVVAEP